MIININTDLLLSNKLNINQFILLQIIAGNNKITFSKLLHTFPEMEKDLENLLNNGLVKKVGRGNLAYSITDLYKTSILSTNLFDEFIELFPTTITRPDGTKEYLKTDVRRSKAKYEKITENRIDMHEHIMKCLQAELRQKQLTSSMKFFKKLYNWLNSETWKEYEHLINTSEQETELINLTDGYGTNVE